MFQGKGQFGERNSIGTKVIEGVGFIDWEEENGTGGGA